MTAHVIGALVAHVNTFFPLRPSIIISSIAIIIYIQLRIVLHLAPSYGILRTMETRDASQRVSGRIGKEGPGRQTKGRTQADHIPTSHVPHAEDWKARRDDVGVLPEAQRRTRDTSLLHVPESYRDSATNERLQRLQEDILTVTYPSPFSSSHDEKAI